MIAYLPPRGQNDPVSFSLYDGVHTAGFRRLCGVVAWVGAVGIFAGVAGRGLAAARV